MEKLRGKSETYTESKDSNKKFTEKNEKCRENLLKKKKNSKI